MKMKYLIILLIAMSTNVKAQSVNETVNFINEAIMESTKSALDLFNYDQIKVNEKGKIVSDIYARMPTFIIMESRSAYLKNLKYMETKYFAEENGTNHYIIVLKCLDETNCVSRIVKTQDNVKPYNEITITVYTKAQSEKIKSAFIHLLNLSKTNPAFLTNDLF